MARLCDFWQEWVADNPFVKRELRRWGRRGYAWKMPLWNAAIPALVLSGAQWLYSAGPAWLQPALPPQPGTLMFSAAALLHLFILFGFGHSLLSLYQEAVAERLDFVRALPMDHRELLLKMGVARSLMLGVAALAGLPAYLLAIAYGGVDLMDVAVYYAVLLALASGPPSAMDITMARSARRSADGTRPRQANADPTVVFRIIFLQAFFQFFVRAVVSLRRQPSGISGILGRILPPGASQAMHLFPFALFPAAVRFLWMPQPFYHVALPPIVLLAAWWLLRRAAQTAAAAELWAREPMVETLPQERTLITFPEETGREMERRTARRLGQAASSLLFLGVTGFAWESTVESGRLGHLVGSATPAGAAAALFLLAAGTGVLAAMYRIRWQCLSPYRPAKETPADAGQTMARPILAAAAAVVAACVVGTLWPWPDLALAGARLLVAAAGTLVFAIGWRSMLGEQPHRLGSGVQVGLGLAELAFLAGPILALLFATSPVWHAVAALSPVYSLAWLFTGLWATPPLPITAAAAIPAALGGALLLLSRRRGPAAAAEKPERSRRDPLDAWVDGLAQRWDNAYFSLEVRRQLRKPTGFGLRLLASLAGILFFSSIFALPLLLMPSRHNLPLWERLGHVGKMGISLGLLFSLLGCAMILLMLGVSALAQLTAGVREEHATARAQCRLPFLVMSALSDRDIVLGVLATRTLRVAPQIAAAVALSLLWCVFGLPFGMPWWGLAIWAWAMLAIAAVTLTLALHTFHAWRGFDWVALLTTLLPLTPMLLIFGARAAGAGPWEWIADHRWPLLGAAGVLPLVLAALMPKSLRSAVGAVNACRTRRDVDIPATAPGA